MVRSAQSALNQETRFDILAVARAAIAGAGAGRAVTRALHSETFRPSLSVPLHIVAVGKAASSMVTAAATSNSLDIRTLLAVGTHREVDMPDEVEWHPAAHPVADARSVAAATRVLEVAAHVASHECLVLLISGGASSLLALPAAGLTLDDKQHSVRTMMLAGADITALNAVRKHLSAIKGGRLAEACAGATLTLAVSDVVGDELSVIGSGPGVADPSDWRDAQEALNRYGGPAHRASVRQHIARGVAGDLADTPKPGARSLARVSAHLIASRRDALRAAAADASARGYVVQVIEEDVCGEARVAARRWLETACSHLRAETKRVCVLSAGETTVRVNGRGRGGRNQELALALVGAVRDAATSLQRHLMVASIGSDGIDGPTDAAGAIVDATTAARAATLGLAPQRFLADNDSYAFFAELGDLVHLGRTDTNVGDLQILLAHGLSAAAFANAEGR